VQFKALQLTGVKESLQSKRKRRLKYFTRLAGQLASEGKLLEFVEFLQMLAKAGIDTTIFTQAVDLDQVDAGLSLILVDGQLDLFVTLMQKLHDVGFAPWRFVGEGARALLSAELRKCLANSKAQRCVQIIQKLTGCGFLAKKLVEPSRVIVACVRTRSVELSYSYVQLLSRNAWHYNAMIREFGYHCELGSAFTVFDLMKKEGVSPDLHTYRALIDACGRSGEPSKAAVVFEGMIKDGIIPNVFVYNSLMNVNVGDMDEVQRLYDHMVGAGVAADLTTFNILLKACGASGRAELATTYYQQIKQRGDVTMDVVTYSTLINVFRGAKMWEEALKVKADMLLAGVTPNVFTWTSIIGACAEVGLVEQSFQEFGEMLDAGCNPNGNCYNMLIHACVIAGQHERAFQLFHKWKQTGRIRLGRNSEQLAWLSPNESNEPMDVGSDLADQSRQESSWGSKNGLRRRFQGKPEGFWCKPNLVSYNILMKACGSDPKRTQALMVEMESLGFVPDVKSWSILMDAYGSSGDISGCLMTLSRMKESGLTPDVVTYTTLMKACVHVGDTDKAFSFFEQMKAEGVRPNVVTYNTLLRAQRGGQFREVQRGLALYEEMREAGYVPNDFLLQGLLKEWAEGGLDKLNRIRWSSGHDITEPENSKDNDSERGISEFTEALLQKVAVHARGDNTQDLIIDLHGLSKAEARTAVLAVLRIIKERHSLEDPIKDDLVIITGVGRRSDIPGSPVIRDVVLQVLETELGLPVTSTPLDGHNLVSTAVSSGVRPEMQDESVGSTRSNKVAELIMPRKPLNSGRLKVAKEALNAWVQRRGQKQ